jgi:hypothetical protein
MILNHNPRRQVINRELRAGGKNVNSMTMSWIIFALVFGSALGTMVARNVLPKSHLSADSKDVIRLSIALISTMEALVLSLLIASAKSAFDMRRNHLAELAADIILLDRDLAHYGPETNEARALLRNSVAATVERFWPVTGTPSAVVNPAFSVEALYNLVEALSPQSDAQRALRSQALNTARNVDRTRALLFGNLGTSIPIPFLTILVFWLCIIFASFGLFAPRNATVIVVLGICALSVSGAVFLILELDRSIGGLLQVSDAPLRAALAQLVIPLSY